MAYRFTYAPLKIIPSSLNLVFELRYKDGDDYKGNGSKNDRDDGSDGNYKNKGNGNNGHNINDDR